MATCEKSEGQRFSALAICYPNDIITENGRKKYKAKILWDFPETLRAEFTILNDNIIKADLLFYTEHPNAWHTALLSAKNRTENGWELSYETTIHGHLSQI